MSFKDLGLSDPILQALEELKFETPTEIQAGAIPILLKKEKDFIGLAHTGTGKTAAFALPLLDLIDTSEYRIQALILSPTRELCQQIADQIDLFNKHNRKLKTSVVYGGTAISPQLRNLNRPPHILIATPGRLLDHISRKSVNLSQLEYLVLDEADEMLNMGFKEDIDKILKSAPKEKATWLFSATMPKGIRRIVEKFMRDEVEELQVSSGSSTNKNISHQYIIHKRNKQELLCRFLDTDTSIRAIVFCRTKAGTQSLADDLSKKGYDAAALHGDMSQAQRTNVMDKFKANKLSVCVATDVAARGIDVNDLTHVFHHQLPDDSAYYTHRSGRTARGGKSGISISLVSKSEVRKIRTLERELDTKFEEVQAPDASMVLEINLGRWADKLLAAKMPKGADYEVITRITAKFEELDPNEILEKVIALEVTKITAHQSSTRESDSGGRRDRGDRGDRGGRNSRDRDRGDRNSRDRGDRRDRDRGDRRERGDRGDRRERKDRDRGESYGEYKKDKDKTRFFINVGTRDEISRSELISFLSEQTGIKKNDFGRIDIDSSHSYFEVENDSSKQVMGSFKGFSIDGRELRVNPDGENFESKPKKKKKDSKKDSKGKGRRNR